MEFVAITRLGPAVGVVVCHSELDVCETDVCHPALQVDDTVKRAKDEGNLPLVGYKDVRVALW